MALLFVDGLDHYSETFVNNKWTGSLVSGSGTIQLTINNSFGRLGSGGARCFQNVSSNNGSVYFWRTYINRQTVVVGFAFRVESWTNNFDNAFLALYDLATVQLDIRLDTSFRPYVTRNGTTLFTAPTALALGVWNFIELKANVHSSSGYTELRLNGNVQGTFSGNTSGSGNAYSNLARFGFNFPALATRIVDLRFDDVYLLEADSGVGTTDFLGDCRVQTLLPSAAGTTTGMTKTGAAATNWQSVNETVPDTTSTVASNTAGVYDTYQYPDLATTTNRVVAVAQSFVWQKDDAGVRTATARVRSGATEADFATPVIPLTGSYTVLQQIQETNPVTGLAWTVSDVNAAEIGPKVAT